MPREPRVEPHDRERPERRSEEEEQRVPVGEAVAVDLDGVAERVTETVEMEGEVEEQRDSS
jgi:folate-dependent tRNA-U54 methylase TrmFO/GidA